MTDDILLHRWTHAVPASVRFFNGRVLTGSDLSREQDAVTERDRRLARALGPGVLDGLDVSIAGTQVKVTAGHAITPGGALVELADVVGFSLVKKAQASSTSKRSLKTPTDRPFTDEPTPLLELPEPTHELRRPTPAPTSSNPSPPSAMTPVAAARDPSLLAEPRPYADSASLTRPDGARLYLLSLRHALDESPQTAILVGTDRSNDRCTADHRDAVVEFLLTPQSTAKLAPRDRNAVADAYLTDRVKPAGPADSVPLALVCIADDGVLWLDTWSVRRRVLAGAAASEARLLQFQDQLQEHATESAAKPPRFTRIPPAAELPIGWAQNDAWRDFFGPKIAPLAAIPCDAAVLPALIAAASSSPAIALDAPDADETPAVDVYAGYAADELVALVYTRATLARAQVELAGAPPDAVVAVHLVPAGADAPRFALRRDRDTALWVSPDVPPGDYDVLLDSDTYAASEEPRLRMTLIGGRTLYRGFTLTRLRGGIRVEIEGLLPAGVDSIVATSELGRGHTIAAEKQRVGSSWQLSGLSVGTWTVTANAVDPFDSRARFQRSATVTVEADQIVDLVFDLDTVVRAPDRTITAIYETFGKQYAIKLGLLETSVTAISEREREVKAADTHTRARELHAAVGATTYKVSALALTGASASAAFAKQTVKVVAPVGTAVAPPAYDALAIWAGNLASETAFKRWDPPAELTAWLAGWQRWLAAHEARRPLRAAILSAKPYIELEKGASLLTLAVRKQRPREPEAWAVFGPTRLPLAVVRLHLALPRPYRPADLFEILATFQQVESDLPRSATLDELASWPASLFNVYLRSPLGGPDDLATAVVDRAVQARKTLEYVPGMTLAARAALGDLAEDPIVLANANPTRLIALLKNSLGDLAPVLVAYLLAITRASLPAATWSLAAADFPGAAELASAGLSTLGDLAYANPANLQHLATSTSTSDLQTRAETLLKLKLADRANVYLTASATDAVVSPASADEPGAIDLANLHVASMSTTTFNAATATAAALTSAQAALSGLHENAGNQFFEHHGHIKFTPT